MFFLVAAAVGCNSTDSPPVDVTDGAGPAGGFTEQFKNIYDDPDTDSKAWTRYWVSAP